MSQQLYSVDQVARLLGLHVKTVRGYVRDGRLKAVRIGKQYRITGEDLAAFTGDATDALRRDPRRRRAEASTIVQIDAVSPELMTRVSTMVMAADAGGGSEDGIPRRAQTVYDPERASLKIVLLGGLAYTADMLKIISALAEDRS